MTIDTIPDANVVDRRIQSTSSPAVDDGIVRSLMDAVRALDKALSWYVESDETGNMPDNAPWLAGRLRAMEALKDAPVGVLMIDGKRVGLLRKGAISFGPQSTP